MIAIPGMKANPNFGLDLIMQSAAALTALGGPYLANRVFRSVGLEALLGMASPSNVGEGDAVALHGAIIELLPPEQAHWVVREAGRRAGRDILKKMPFRMIRPFLHILPTEAGGFIILNAIARNSSSFAGSTQFRCQLGPPLCVEIQNNHISVPGCPWYRALLETVFEGMTRSPVNIAHTKCQGYGRSLCRFEFRFRSSDLTGVRKS